MTQTIGAFEFADYGVDHAQYFPGVGTAYTDWNAVYIGCGESEREAADDALDKLCSSDVHIPADVVEQMSDAAFLADDTYDAHLDCETECDCEELGRDCLCHDECELVHYVALFVRYTDSE